MPRAYFIERTILPSVGALSLYLASPSIHAAEPYGPEERESRRDLASVTPARALGPLHIDYPEHLAAQNDAPRGEVEIEFLVGVEGKVLELRVIRGIHSQVDQTVVDALRELPFEPARYRGQAVEARQRVEVRVTPPPRDELVAEDTEHELPASPPGPDVVQPVRIEGTVYEAGRRQVVGDVEVVASPPSGGAWMHRARTDERGQFTLRGLPDGPVRVRVVSAQFREFGRELELAPGERLDVKFYLDRREIDPYRTTVFVDRERSEVVRRSLSAEELATAPGSLGDPLRALQNLPGVARTPFGAGGLVIRGTSPYQSSLFVDGHPLPRLYHFFAISTVFQASLLESIEFVPGNFSARYGNAIGGIIHANLDSARDAKGVHGHAGLSLIDLSAKVATRVGEGSLVMAGRRSHLDTLVGLGMRIGGAVDSVPMPRYWDYQLAFDHPVGPGRVWVRAFGSDDRMINVPVAQARDDEDIQLVNGFHRADLGFETKSGRLSWLLNPSYLYEDDEFGIAGDMDLHQESSRHTVSLRSELRYSFGSSKHLTLGTYGARSFWHSERPAQLDPEWDFEAANSGQRASSDGRRSRLAHYLLGHFEFGPVTVMPEVRYSLYAEPFRRHAVDPRLRFRFALSDSTRLSFGGGLYSQAPAFSVFEGSYRTRSKTKERAPLERSAHAGLSLAQSFPHGLSFELSGYYAYMWNLSKISSINVMVPLFVSHSVLPEATTRGHRFGLEVMLRKQLTKYLYGWVAYTFAKSVRRGPQDDAWVPFDFDQTHNLTAVLGVRFPRHYRISARFRLTSGNPYTDCGTQVFDTDWGRHECIPGPENAARLPMFHQLDLRFDKTWVKNLTKVMLYLDLFNVYHQKNVEFRLPGPSPEETRNIYGMPFLPSLGLEVKF